MNLCVLRRKACKEKNIWALFIKPEFEGLGIGRKLHHIMLNWYFMQGKDKVWLGTAPNTRAERFYKKSGWMQTGTHGKNEIKFEMTYKLCMNLCVLRRKARKEKNIWALFLNPEFEGLGIGRNLQHMMLNWYFMQGKDKVWLGTAPNTRAERFYKKSGWMQTGTHGKNEIKFEMTYKNWMELSKEQS